MELTNENYYSEESNKVFFSTSQYKSFLDCEARTMAEINGKWKREPSTAMLVGSWVDAFVEGTLEEFKEANKDVLLTQKGTLRAEFKKAEELCKKISDDELFMKYLSGDKQTIIEFELGGAPWKAKLDSFLKGVCISDLKVVQSFDSLVKYGYEIQGASYQEAVRQKYGETLPFYLTAVTKETIPNIDIFEIPQDVLDMELIAVKENMPHLIDVKSGKVEPTSCGKCPYCLSKKKATVRNWLELL